MDGNEHECDGRASNVAATAMDDTISCILKKVLLFSVLISLFIKIVFKFDPSPSPKIEVVPSVSEASCSQKSILSTRKEEC